MSDEISDERWPVGTTESATRTITAEDIERFAEVSMDRNPVHLDSAYASTTMFGRRIAHGMLCASMFSSILGTRMPGQGTIYLGQELSFKAPVFIDDTVTAVVTVVEYLKPRIIRLTTVCRNQDGTVVVDGAAVVKLPD